jgi:hypothetical protein
MTYRLPARWTTAELYGAVTTQEVTPPRVLRKDRLLRQAPVDLHDTPEPDQAVVDMHAFTPDARDPEPQG